MTFECLGQNLWNSSCQFWNDKSISLRNFVSFLIVITHNSSVNLSTLDKRIPSSPNFETFERSGENLPNSFCHFPNHKSVFLQILHHSSVSWKIISLYFLSSNNIYFAQKEPINVKIFETGVFGSKFVQFLMSILKWQVDSSSNFSLFFSVITHNCSLNVYFIHFLL